MHSELLFYHVIILIYSGVDGTVNDAMLACYVCFVELTPRHIIRLHTPHQDHHHLYPVVLDIQYQDIP